MILIVLRTLLICYFFRGPFWITPGSILLPDLLFTVLSDILGICFIHLFSFFSTRKMCISQGKKILSYSPLYTQYLELYLVHIQCSKYIIIWNSPARKIWYLWSWGSKFSRASWFASGTEPISNTIYLPLLASIWTPLKINFEPKFNYAWYLENTI